MQILESMHFLLLGHKGVYGSWKSLPNYFPSLMNQFVMLEGLYNSTSVMTTSLRLHVIMYLLSTDSQFVYTFTLIIWWVLPGRVLPFWFAFLGLLATQIFFPCVFILLTFLFCELSFNIIFPFTNVSGSQPELNRPPEIMPGNIFGCYNLEMRAAAGI